MHLARYRSRFGGEGTIVTLDDGRAFTAAHCLASVDGRAGTLIASADGRQWRVVRRASPRGSDLAVLRAVGMVPGNGGRKAAGRARYLGLCPGLEITFVGHTGRHFETRRARVVTVTATRVVADVLSDAGVRAGDSGGPVLVGEGLVGIVIARAGRALSYDASSQLVLSRIALGS